MKFYLKKLMLLICFAASIFLIGCGEKVSAPLDSSTSSSLFGSLYVVSGSCYAGGATVSTGPANTVSRFDLETGAHQQVIADYNVTAPGDSPVAIYEYDEDNILVLVENTGGRRIDKVRKDGSGYTSFLINTTALSAVLRSFVVLSDLGLLVSKSKAIEKFNASKARVLQGANPYVNAPAGACATSTTLISSVTTHSSGKIVFTHAGATPNNKVVSVSASGYVVAGDCLSGLAGPVKTSLPTRAMFHSNGKLFVSYGSATTASNSIYSYDYNGTSGVISGATAAYTDIAIINGPSSMAEDPRNGFVYVANASATFNNIERFSVSGGVLTRVPGQTFIPSSIYTRCPADIKVIR